MQINSTRDVTAAVRGRRQELGLTQAQVAADAGVSREWINAFEAGKSTVEFHLVFRLLDALGLALDLVDRGSVPASSGAVDLDGLLHEYRNQ